MNNDTRDAQEHQKELEEREQWELWLKSDPAFQEWLEELDKFLDKGEDDGHDAIRNNRIK